MSVDELARLAAQLSPTERLQLVEKIIHDLIAASQTEPARRRFWRELRGRLTYPALGEDAQAWVSRTRQESDAQREVP